LQDNLNDRKDIHDFPGVTNFRDDAMQEIIKCCRDSSNPEILLINSSLFFGFVHYLSKMKVACCVGRYFMGLSGVNYGNSRKLFSE
jgi:hypothetical protein